ncbi:hypothetical protein ACVWXQ_009678 [Bradyrhizobium sp. S3.14.4]
MAVSWSSLASPTGRRAIEDIPTAISLQSLKALQKVLLSFCSTTSQVTHETPRRLAWLCNCPDIHTED